MSINQTIKRVVKYTAGTFFFFLNIQFTSKLLCKRNRRINVSGIRCLLTWRKRQGKIISESFLIILIMTNTGIAYDFTVPQNFNKNIINLCKTTQMTSTFECSFF